MPDERLPGSVLFACSMNSVRSPMAEALMKYLHGHHVFVDSAGLEAAEVDTFAVAAMDELALDLSGHRAKTIETVDPTSFDLAIALAPEVRDSLEELARGTACEVEYWRMPDPVGVGETRIERLEAYRDVRNRLMDRILVRFPGSPDSRVSSLWVLRRGRG
jgi:protein-tyrosine-phosphatase